MGSLEDLRRLIDSKKGSPLIVTLWATWCAPCVKEVPVFNEALTRFEDEGLQVLGVSVDGLTEPDPFAGRALVSRFARTHGIDYPIFYYDGDPDPLGGEFDWPGPIPFSVILNAEGAVMDTLVGAMPEAVLMNRIAETLREGARARPKKKLL